MTELLRASRGRWTEWTRRHRVVLSLIAHVVLFGLSWLLAFGLAYNFRFFERWFDEFFLPLLPVVVLIKLTVFAAMGLHRAWWRYVGLRDLFSITQAAWVSFLIAFVLYYMMANAHLLGIEVPIFGDRFPDSVFILDFGGTIGLVCGTRVAVRLYFEEIRSEREGNLPRLLILGAGDCGANVVREILRMPLLRYEVVGFLDDDPGKLRARIHNVEVLGPISELKEIATRERISEILVAMPSATRSQMRRVVELAHGTGLHVKTVPALSDLISGKVNVAEFREVDIHDLLGRAPVTLDERGIGEFLRPRVVMVTGAGGSIGSEMCRQIARFKPQRLVLVEQAEQHLFEIDRELRASFPGLSVAAYVCDVTDASRVASILGRERPAAVYHAAAHKHVPMMELNPGEAIKNNILGTRVVADAAAACGCEKFVMVSTDKAVNPTSIMGASKRVAEMYIQGLDSRVSTQFVTVRFGNVLGSSGSVIPIFKEQIARGGPVTVTHPEMTRYFMTIPEAAQLVLQAGCMGKGGEIFVLDMGEPVRIVDLARDLIKLSGLRPGEDIAIEFVGMRPGEKLFEELSIAGENVSLTSHPKIGIWTNRPEEWEMLLGAIHELVSKADGLDRESARSALKRIVPEFQFESPGQPAPRTAGAPVEAPLGAAPMTAVVAPRPAT